MCTEGGGTYQAAPHILCGYIPLQDSTVLYKNPTYFYESIGAVKQAIVLNVYTLILLSVYIVLMNSKVLEHEKKPQEEREEEFQRLCRRIERVYESTKVD